MLGVVLDLSESTKGVVKVSNKPSRMSELKDVLSCIVKSGKKPTKNSASVFWTCAFC